MPGGFEKQRGARVAEQSERGRRQVAGVDVLGHCKNAEFYSA